MFWHNARLKVRWDEFESRKKVERRWRLEAKRRKGRSKVELRARLFFLPLTLTLSSSLLYLQKPPSSPRRIFDSHPLLFTMSPPLRVPLEVLERILAFAFAPLSFPSSCSPITSKDLLAPPLGTSHLLFVSRGFRRLALPLYYHTIAVVSPLDWETFFDPESGLLVGEENEERASFVKNLWINVADEARIPIDEEHLKSALEDEERPDRILVELERTSLPRLTHLLLFLCGMGEQARSSLEASCLGIQRADEEDIWWEMVDERLSDEFWEDGGGFELDEAGKEVWGSEWRDFLVKGIQRLYREVDYPSPDELSEQTSSEREDAWSLFIDPDLPPRRVEITLDGLGEKLLLQLDSLGLFSTSDQPFDVLPPAGLDLKTKMDEQITVDAIRGDLDRLDFARKHSLLFEAFPRSFWEMVRMEEGCDPVELGEGWMWKKEDGSVVRLKKTFAAEEVSCGGLFLSLPSRSFLPPADLNHSLLLQA